MSQCVCRRGAHGQVVGVQILQRAARLGNDGCRIVLNDGQRGAYGSNASRKDAAPDIWFGALRQGGFSSLQLLFDGGMSTDKK